MRGFIVDVVQPGKKTIGAIRTDEGKEFQGEFQGLLMEHCIRQEMTAPDTPKCNRVAERVLGLLLEKVIALLETHKEVNDKNTVG